MPRMKRYVVYSYDDLGEGALRARQRRVGLFDDRAEADQAAWDAVVVGGRDGAQVLRGGLQVYWVDRDEMAHGAREPRKWTDADYELAVVQAEREEAEKAAARRMSVYLDAVRVLQQAPDGSPWRKVAGVLTLLFNGDLGAARDKLDAVDVGEVAS